MAEIMIVEDDRVVREGLKGVLQGEGFSVRTARDGEDALRKVREKKPDLVLLDVMMPKLNGFRCCEEIRRMDALLPVIFLTAKDSEADQVRGMGLGGDNYVSKGDGEALLLACIQRALARMRGLDDHARRVSGQLICLENVTVDLQTLVVIENGVQIAQLTKTEADLLRILNAHVGTLVETDALIAALRGQGFACEDTMLYMHMCNLRRKLGSAAVKIVNRRGAGYYLVRR